MVKMISRIEIQTLAHSTEDLDEVKVALLNIISPSDRDSIKLDRDELSGYYRNPISLLKVNLRGEQVLDRTIRLISSMLSEEDKKTIASKLDLMSDKSGSLYLRLDKQMAHLGVLKLGSKDPIRVRIKFLPVLLRTRDIYSLTEEIGIVP